MSNVIENIDTDGLVHAVEEVLARQEEVVVEANGTANVTVVLTLRLSVPFEDLEIPVTQDYAVSTHEGDGELLIRVRPNDIVYGTRYSLSDRIEEFVTSWVGHIHATGLVLQADDIDVESIEVDDFEFDNNPFEVECRN